MPDTLLTPEQAKEIAKEAVKEALRDIGLGDEQARKDVNDIRDLLSAFRGAKRTIWSTFWRLVTTAIVAALVVWFGLPKING